MISRLLRTLNTSIMKKQLVAVTGLMLVGFIAAHLAGNFTIFGGEEWFNSYAKHLEDLGIFLWVGHIGLVVLFSVHIALTVLVTLENRKARGPAYEASGDLGRTTFAKKTMIYTGILLALFILLHLWDFTFGDKHADDGTLELFALVQASFLQPWRVAVYLLAMAALGFHLSHCIQSFFQTLGANDEESLPWLERLANAAGIVIALGFSSIPIYIIVRHYAGSAG
jgi:succinate dehydrogenase / fumarate reductase cytochrome b subunit